MPTPPAREQTRSSTNSRTDSSYRIEATRGGAETMYPEYMQKLKNHQPRSALRLRARKQKDKDAPCDTVKFSCAHGPDAVRDRAAAVRPSSEPRQCTKSTCCPCRATSTCWWARAATSPCKPARTACCWSIPVWSRMQTRSWQPSRKCPKGPIRYIINTHVHPDHTGGNEKIAKAGRTIAGGNVVGNIGESAGEGAAVIAHENVLNRMSAPDWQTGSHTARRLAHRHLHRQ